MPYDPATAMESRRAARRFVSEVRALTVCERCGRQPVEWHHDEHVAYPHRRVGRLVSLGASITRIQREIAMCTALCRSCHMDLDGRAAALTAARPRKKGDVFPAKPCRECGRPSKPLRRGLCSRCYQVPR